jgi:hypothetical protein
MTSIEGSSSLPFASFEYIRNLVSDLRIDLEGKISSFRLFDSGSRVLVESGATLRFSLVQGNCIATVRLCQGMAAHVLSTHAFPGVPYTPLPSKAAFMGLVQSCLDDGVLSQHDAQDLHRLAELQNCLSAFRESDDLSSAVQERLFDEAIFAMEMVNRLLALPRFRGPEGVAK